MNRNLLRFAGAPGSLAELPFVRDVFNTMLLCFMVVVMTFGAGMWVVLFLEAALKGVLNLTHLAALRQLLFEAHPHGLWATEQLFGHFIDLVFGVGFLVGITQIKPGSICWFDRTRFRFGFAQLLAYVAFAYGVYYGVNYLVFDILQVGAQQGAGPQTSQAMLLTPIERIPMLISTLIVSPILEELMFRGYVYNLMRTSLRHAWTNQLFLAETVAILFSAGLFTIMHAFGANSVGLLQIMIGAVILTALYRKTGNLLAPILLHLTLNGIIWYHMLAH